MVLTELLVRKKFKTIAEAKPIFAKDRKKRKSVHVHVYSMLI
jgi:hypothetical protein